MLSHEHQSHTVVSLWTQVNARYFSFCHVKRTLQQFCFTVVLKLETLYYSINIVPKEKETIWCIRWAKKRGSMRWWWRTGVAVLAWGHGRALISTLTHLALVCLLTWRPGAQTAVTVAVLSVNDLKHQTFTTRWPALQPARCTYIIACRYCCFLNRWQTPNPNIVPLSYLRDYSWEERQVSSEQTLLILSIYSVASVLLLFSRHILPLSQGSEAN